MAPRSECQRRAASLLPSLCRIAGLGRSEPVIGGRDRRVNLLNVTKC